MQESLKVSQKTESGSQDVAWLCLTKPTNSFVAERDGYSDEIGSRYSWDNTVPNHAKPKAGDIVGIWDGTELLGISQIESIDVSASSKNRRRCPNDTCRSTDVRRRKGSTPIYKCGKCQFEFDTPNAEEIQVAVYTADFEAGWTKTQHIDASACRTLSLKRDSQHSIREAHAPALQAIVDGMPSRLNSRFKRRNSTVTGGHKLATVSIRVGQGAFRKSVLEKFSSVCAFTGLNHEAALEAAHLYRYSEHGTHHNNGGLLMRRDVHRLFDLGLIAVDYSTKTIDIHPELSPATEYKALHKQPLKVKISAAHWAWLALHWDQFRGQEYSTETVD